MGPDAPLTDETYQPSTSSLSLRIPQSRASKWGIMIDFRKLFFNSVFSMNTTYSQLTVKLDSKKVLYSFDIGDKRPYKDHRTLRLVKVAMMSPASYVWWRF